MSDQDQLDRMERQLTSIHKYINGHNGAPGLKVRVDRLERFQATASKLIWLIIVVGITNIAVLILTR